MHMRHQWMLAAAALTMTMVAFGQKNSPEAMLGAGLHQEEVEGNCREAIKTFEKVIQQKNAPRQVAARAQLHIGMCHEKLGGREAQRHYEQVVSKFGDQAEIAGDAARRLTALGGAPSIGPGAPVEYLGVWSGTATQDDGQTWPLLITFMGGRVGSVVARIAYPSPNCAGELTLQAVSTSSIELVEDLTFNALTCEDDGIVTLKPSRDNELEYFWSKPAFRGTAMGVLRKQPSELDTLQLAWVDRTGKELSRVRAVAPYRGIMLSPDGKRLAVHRHAGSGGDIFILDLASSATSRLTVDANGQQDNSSPVWSPDGTRIVFGSHRNGKWGLYVKRADGTGGEELVIESASPQTPTSWSPDGKSIVYWVSSRETLSDTWLIPLTGDRKPVPLLKTQFNERNGQISPDGKWIAYHGNEDGQGVYIRSFPGGSGKIKVSGDLGGVFPVWSRDGRELYFFSRSSRGKLIAVDIRVEGSRILSGTPQALFETGYVNLPHDTDYRPFADGQRFLIPRWQLSTLPK